MVFPADLEQRLGVDQLRERLLAPCLGEPGRAKVNAMTFMKEPEHIRVALMRVKETVDRQQSGEEVPLSAYGDPTPWQYVLAVEGGYLELGDLAVLTQSMEAGVTANSALSKNPESYPRLHELALPGETGKKIASRLRSAIDVDGSVRDKASTELSRIRRRLREEELKARKMADQLMRLAVDNGWSAEGSHPTLRDGRLVIPVLAEHKRKMKGYLIDQSSTGQTVFLEPAEVLEANNDFRDLVLEEWKEIVRILRELTAFVRDHREEILSVFDLLGHLDFLRSKARLAVDLEATLPEILPEPELQWSNARHPLLYFTLKGKRPLVPLTVSLTRDDRFLLVSGPNAGGKSVCLKTVGLIQYMIQCGLLPPISADSLVGIFRSIFLDIGDQQSIESDLSTYSSHLKNMATFLRDGDDRSLVLMDELGSGTDPNLGGGIAQAILEQLVRRGVWGLATTHYYNLKVFASQTPGIRNASMQFDAEHLTPLFRLEIGQPGSSFALEIARKTGLPPETLDAAGRIIGSELVGLEQLMKNVANDKVKLEARERELRALEREANDARERYESLNDKLDTQKKEIINRARTEASALLQETNREIEKTIRHIRENRADKQETRKVRDGLKELQNKVKVAPYQVPTLNQGPLKEGDKVRLMGGEVTGTIVSIKGANARVQFGDVMSSVKTARLVRSDRIPHQKPASASHLSLGSHTRSFSPQLDVRGMRVEELVPVLTRFMDDALLFGVGEVSILHGKGEGILRAVVRDYLKSLKTVAAYRDEHADRGGAGITVVVLK